MNLTIFNIVAFLVGLLIFGGSIYYLIKENKDTESRKIYGCISLIGIIIVVIMLIKIFI